MSSRTVRTLPVLALSIAALFSATSATALASSSSSQGDGVASAAHNKKPKKKKAPKPKSKPKPAQPKGPLVAKSPGATGINAGPDITVVQTLSLPAGNYVVTAKAELGNNAAAANSITCQLLENFNPLDSGTESLVPLATFSRTMTLNAASSGGSIKLACFGDRAGQARNRVITAVRV